jgi:integrase
MREGELYAVAESDIDFEREVVHVRQQVKRLGRTWCYGLPKNDTERVVPLAVSTAETLRVHMAQHRPRPVTLPGEKPDGELRTYRLLFVHLESGEHLRAATYMRWWLPTLEAAGIIGPAVKEPSGSKRYVLNSRKHGRHQLRHYYANVQLSGGTNIRELADYLGHHDPGFTLRVYGHLQPDSHERARKAIDERFLRPRAVSDGTGTEQRP